MVQKKSGGMITAKKLDMTNDPRAWENAAEAFLHGVSEIGCPLCKKGQLQITAVCGPDRVGFLLLTCPVCGKSANFSRIKFPTSIKTESF